LQLKRASDALEKQAILGAVTSYFAQNAYGAKLARSGKFKKEIATSAAQGILGKKAPRTLKTVGKDAWYGVAAPEVNSIKNEAYTQAQLFRSKHDVGGMLGKLSKRDQAVARLAAAGDMEGLKRIGQHNNPIIKKIQEQKSKYNVPDIPKKTMKEVGKLPEGSRVPSSNKAAIAANVASIPVLGTGTAALNAAKLAAGTEAAGKTNLMQKAKDKFVTKPLKASFKAGEVGKEFNAKKYWAESLSMNPFTAEANRQAHKAGSTSGKNEIVQRARAAKAEAKRMQSINK
jgi:hypothetical protein